MPTERVQRRIEKMLDEADDAMDRSDWDVVHRRATEVLALDPENEDGEQLLRAARELGAAPGGADKSPDTPSPVEPSRDTPTSFANGRYQVTGFLGEGGKKKVYRVHDTTLDRDVAFGLIKAEGLDEASRQRITREAQAMARLGDNPNIMPIFDLGEENGQPYMVGPLMGGGDVEALIEDTEDGRLSLEDALRITSEICRGLEFAHSKSIIHRDLKPGNVWLTDDGTARIGDFGLAISLDRSRLTQEKMMVGTVSYMPPEQATGGEVTPRSDLYSLGAMLYEMVTGRPPFIGDDEIAIIGQHINTPPVAPSWHNQSLPQSLDSLIMRMLSKNPAERPDSAADVLSALEAIDTSALDDSDSSTSPIAGEGRGEGVPGSLDSMASGVFVGRHREMDQLKATFEDTLGGHGKMVALVGEPGIGKTRTAQELATYASMRGGQVLWGRCYEGGGAPPYWPWVQAIRSYVTDRDAETIRNEMGSTASVIAEIVPDVTERLPDLHPPQQIDDPEAARFRLFDAITTFLKTAANAKPIIIMLEDLHWSDKPSLMLLEFVARELANSRLMIVGNYRDMELNRRHPLSITLGELARERLFERVLLRGLQKHDVRRFIEVAAGIDPPGPLVDAVYTQTEGNPLFVTETVRLLIQEGDITSGARTSGGTSSWEIRIPEGVREVIGRRLDRLSERCNDILTTAAVVGRQFRFGVLLNLIDDASEDMLLDGLDEALDARIIEEVTSEVGLYQFSHALMQETLTSELSANRTVRLHARIAEALERFYGAEAEEHALELVEHFAEAETVLGSDRLVPHLIAAGNLSLANLEYADAIRFFESALETRGRKIRDIQTAEVLANLSQAQGHSLPRHEQQSTVDTRSEAFDIFVSLGEVEKAVNTAAAYFPSIHGPMGTVPMLEHALKIVPPDTREEGMLQALYCQRLSIETGQYEPAIEAHDRAIEIARALDDPNLELSARARALSVHSWHLKWDARVQEVRDSIELLERADLSNDLVEMHHYVVNLMLAEGNFEVAKKHEAITEKLAEQLRSMDAMISSFVTQVEKHRRAGDWRAARESLARAFEFNPFERKVLERAIEIECLAGDYAAAKALIDRAIDHTESLDFGRYPAQVVPSSASKLIFTYCHLTGERYRLDVARREMEFSSKLKNLEPAGEAFIKMAEITFQSFDEPPEDPGDEFQDLAREQFSPFESASIARRYGMIDLAIELLTRFLEESRSEKDQPRTALAAHHLAETLTIRDHPEDREQITELQDEAIAIAQELGMKPLLEDVLSQREILKA